MMSNKKGFTLIELLIVVVIIGILAAIAIPKFANTKEKAYVASMKSDLRNLITAQEAYFSDNNSNVRAEHDEPRHELQGVERHHGHARQRDEHGLDSDGDQRLDGEDLHDHARRRLDGRRRSGLPVGFSQSQSDVTRAGRFRPARGLFPRSEKRHERRRKHRKRNDRAPRERGTRRRGTRARTRQSALRDHQLRALARARKSRPSCVRWSSRCSAKSRASSA